MRDEAFFQCLAAEGYSRNRVSGNHHIFKKPGRGSLPVSVHNHSVREDVCREILRVVRWSDSEFMERTAGIPSPRKKRASNSNNANHDDINNAHADNTTSIPNSTPTSRSRHHVIQPTLLTSPSPQAYAKMKAEQKFQSDQQQKELNEKAESILRTAPARIGAGEHSAVSELISEFLSNTEAVDHHLKEETVMDIAFIGVTALVEELREVLEKTKMGMNNGNDSETSLEGMPFECRDLSILLAVFKELEKKHWRHFGVVKEVRLTVVREAVQIYTDLADLRAKKLEDAMKSGGYSQSLQLFGERCVSQTNNFVKALVGEEDLLIEIVKQAPDTEVARRVRTTLGLHVYTDLKRLTVTPVMTPSNAAKTLNNLIDPGWFVDTESLSKYRQAQLTLAEARENLAQRAAEGGINASSVGGVRESMRVSPLENLRDLRRISESLIMICATWDDDFEKKKNSPGYQYFVKELFQNMGTCVLDEMSIHVVCLLLGQLYGNQGETNSAARISNSDDGQTQHHCPLTHELACCAEDVTSPGQAIGSQVAADICVLLAELTWLVRGVDLTKTYLHTQRDEPAIQNMHTILSCGAIQLWRGNWTNGGVSSSGSSDPDPRPPTGFLRRRRNTLSLLSLFRVGRANPLVEDMLRLSLLHLARKELPLKWRPIHTEVTKATEQMSAWFSVLFQFTESPTMRTLIPPTNHPKKKDIEAVMGLMRGRKVFDCVKLLSAKPLQSEKKIGAKERRQLESVIAKLEVAKAAPLIEKAHVEIVQLLCVHQEVDKTLISLQHVFRLSVIEEEVVGSLEKIVETNKNNRDFQAVFRGGVGRWFARVGGGSESESEGGLVSNPSTNNANNNV